MGTVTLNDLKQMQQPKQVGDLVQGPSGDLAIVVEVGHVDCACVGDMGIRYLGKPYMGIGHMRASDWKLIARAAELAVSQPSAGLNLAATDDWGRPRCQQIGTYVDVDETYQCALVAGHDGDCDPLPIWPEVESA